MGLIRYTRLLAEKDETLLEIHLGKLYFVHNGRNAWHSTWVQKYYTNCFHLTLRDAKKYCESSRTNGTVFYIIETPALVLVSNSQKKYFITQVNVKEPLLGYSTDAVISKEDYHGKVVEGAQDNYIYFGSSIRNAIFSFDRNGRFWSLPPQLTDEVITSYAPT